MFKITFITSNYDKYYIFNKVCNSLKVEYPNEFDFSFFKQNSIDNSETECKKLEEEIEKSDIVYILLHSGVSSFKNFTRIKNIFWGKIPFFIYTTIDDENREFIEQPKVNITLIHNLSQYFTLGEEANYKNIILYTASKLGQKFYPFKEYQYIKWEGIYHNQSILELEKEEKFIEELSKMPVVIAILFHRKEWNTKKKVVDKLIKEIENLGGTPYTIFTNSVSDIDIKSKGIKWVIDNYLQYKGKIIPKVIINLMSYSQSIFAEPGDGTEQVSKSVFEKLHIPVIQAMSTYQNQEDWEKSLQGLDSISLTGCVYYPEFDGQIISVTSCTHEVIVDEFGEREIFIPIDERINKIARMAMGWAKLANKRNQDKKIAIILHNMPPRNDMIGNAFGLDTPNSVKNIVNLLLKIGIKVDYQFQNGNEIIDTIIKGVSNDKRWLNSQKVLEKSIDKISKEQYIVWFKNLDKKIQEKMEEQWGEAPGEFLVYDGLLPVPGILNGNVFIGLQPARAMEEKAEEIYHNTDFIMPHQYYSFYKWIKEVFKADVIIHIGTHGTLEWLPGKEIGLSSSCCPDFNIDDIPHLYLYSINVTGEGLQAKRRSYAALISYMIPALVLSGKYEDIEEIDDLIKQYYQAKLGKDLKEKELKESIIEKVVKYKYHLDMNVSINDIRQNFSVFITKLHSYIEELKSSTIKDGLHILGEAPVGERLVTLIQALLRVENCGMIVADEAIAQSIGYDINLLKENSYQQKNCKTNLMILDDIRNITTDIIREILNEKKYDDVIKKYKEYNIIEKNYIIDLEKNILNVVLPKIQGTIREKESVIAGINGKFIIPGQSGTPTRGNINILPTGTNFYSIDPNKIPSRAAWKIGIKLAEKLLERYLRDEGKYPENIAMIVYSGNTMNTNGDDIAEALYLMGIKPIWLNNGDRVVGLEIIPYEELKRPRIDVTLRISGLFRDTFPVLIKLLEEAVNIVSQLDECDEKNYIKKNFKVSVKKLLEEGCDFEEASSLSKIRVFGCPPGTYGTGIGALIESKKWSTREDLGRAYINWSAHAYGTKYHGEKVENVFINCLQKTELTVKNEPSIEIDMLESDDYFLYHGGLTAAVKYASGKDVNSYSGNSSEINDVKIKNLKEETAKIMRSRILNPKWFEGLKRHGYKGAQEVSAAIDIMFGWDATTEIIENWMYDRFTENFLKNDDNREWIKKNNPHAILNISERLLEANKRGMWNASQEDLELLRSIYLNIEGDIEELEE